MSWNLFEMILNAFRPNRQSQQSDSPQGQPTDSEQPWTQSGSPADQAQQPLGVSSDTQDKPGTEQPSDWKQNWPGENQQPNN